MSKPTPYELWRQAGGDRERYRQLMVEHGMLIPLRPGEKREPLPCGWPDRRIADLDRAHVDALYDDLYRDWPGEPGLTEPDGGSHG